MSLEAIDRLRGLPAGWTAGRCVERTAERSVWRIRNERDERNEILKLVSGAADPEEKKRLAEEFLLLESIRHPHWVKAYGFVHLEDGGVGYRMEELGVAPHSAPVDGWAPRNLDAVRSILGALGTLHAIGYAYLDLKPEQILVGRYGACLIDPGLAAPLRRPLPPRGSWGFIAPELLDAGLAWDHRADLYSLGSLLVQVWTGEKFLGEGSMAEQVGRQRRRPKLRLREQLPEMPEGLDRVVEGLLDPDPARRPASAAAAWEALHTMIGYRDRYLEKEKLPLPLDLPLLPDPMLEGEWIAALEGNGPGRWVMEGPDGSGRHRLLDRLQALAEVHGCAWERTPAELRITIESSGKGNGDSVTCRIGRPGKGERVVSLRSVGAATAQASLSAYQLAPEGGEEQWTHGLLRARLEERAGGEEARRASVRLRRSLAAAAGSRFENEERARLSDVLTALVDQERPSGDRSERLVREGWLEVDPDGALRLAVPPWDPTSLEAAVGEEEKRSAHARHLESNPRQEAWVAATHAVFAGDATGALRLVLPGVEQLHARGSLGRALDLLESGERLLGPSTPDPWLAMHARLALTDGEPGRLVALQSLAGDAVPPEWKRLLEAHLALRTDRKKEALAVVQPLREGTNDPLIRRIAGTMAAKILAGLGQHEESIASGNALLETMTGPDTATERLELASILIGALSESGQVGPKLERLREISEELIERAGARERCLISSSLGGAAFRRGEFSEAKRHLERSVVAAREWGDRLQRAIAETNLAGIYFEEGRLAECEATNRRAISLFEQVGDRSLAAGTRLNVVSVLCVTGRWGEALVLARQARDQLESLAALDDADAAALLEETALNETGLLGAAAGVAEGLHARLEERPQPILETILARDLGRAARWQGDLEEALEHWERSRKIATDVGAADEAGRTLLESASAHFAAGRGEEGRMQLETAEGAIEGLESAELLVRRAYTLAMSHALEDRPEALREAEDHLEGARRAAVEANLLPWVWRCHAASSGVRRRLGLDADSISSLRLGEEGLRELLTAIGTEALQDAYLALPDPRRFLAWLEGDRTVSSRSPIGSSDLEVFLR